MEREKKSTAKNDSKVLKQCNCKKKKNPLTDMGNLKVEQVRGRK